MDCSTPGFPILHYFPEFSQIHVYWVGEALQPSHPLLPTSASAFNLSQHQDLSNESALCIRWPKYWNFSISPSNECSELISSRIDWFDLLAVQETCFWSWSWKDHICFMERRLAELSGGQVDPGAAVWVQWGSYCTHLIKILGSLGSQKTKESLWLLLT